MNKGNHIPKLLEAGNTQLTTSKISFTNFYVIEGTKISNSFSFTYFQMTAQQQNPLE